MITTQAPPQVVSCFKLHGFLNSNLSLLIRYTGKWASITQQLWGGFIHVQLPNAHKTHFGPTLHFAFTFVYTEDWMCDLSFVICWCQQEGCQAGKPKGIFWVDALRKKDSWAKRQQSRPCDMFFITPCLLYVFRCLTSSSGWKELRLSRRNITTLCCCSENLILQMQTLTCKSSLLPRAVSGAWTTRRSVLCLNRVM